MVQTGLESRRKGNSGGVLGNLTRRFKVAKSTHPVPGRAEDLLHGTVQRTLCTDIPWTLYPDVQRTLCTVSCTLKLGQNYVPIYVKSQNEALRKLGSFLYQNDTLYVNWDHLSRTGRNGRTGVGGGARAVARGDWGG